MSTKIKIGARYRHVRRGTTYEVLGRARMQLSAETLKSIVPAFNITVASGKTFGDHVAGQLEKRTFIVYVSDDDERSLWVRPEIEFCDGRFVMMED